MAGGDLPYSFTVSGNDLKALIDRTRFAISSEETRYYLNGIYLHAASSDGVPVLRAVATDGHRLARVQVPLPEGAAGMPGVIVPRKTVVELRKLLDEGGDEVTISLSETKIRFAFDDAAMTSKLIDGTFPDYERVIPADNEKVLEVDCKLFSQAVDRVSAISTERSRAIKLAVAKGSITLSASSPESGSAVEELEASYDVEPDRDRLQFALPARHHAADRGRRGALRHGRCRQPDRGARSRRWRRALRADADARVTMGAAADRMA